MSEPAPVYQTGADPTPITPAYDDLVYYAQVGRVLTQKAGYALDQRPPANLILRALRAQGAAMQTSQLPR